MKKLIVLENNCGDHGQEYKNWLEKNLPDDIELDFRSRTTGVGGGLFEGGEEIEGGGNQWWDKFCNEI